MDEEIDNSNLDSEGPSPEIIAEAKQMGWVPKEEFRGDLKKWTDAETFAKRGRQNLPIVLAENRRLRADLSGTQNKVTQIEQALNESREAIEALKEFNSDANLKALKDSKAAIVSQLKQARKEGDTDAEVELQDQLTDTTVALREAENTPPPKKEPKTPEVQTVTPSPEFLAWQDENAEWWGKNQRKTGVAIAIANELRADPANRNLSGKAFYDKIDAELNATLREENPRRNGVSKVGEGDLGEGGGGTGSSYNDLPAVAKAACEKQAAKLVGPNRAFKDMKTWRAAYAKTYFEV